MASRSAAPASATSPSRRSSEYSAGIVHKASNRMLRCFRKSPEGALRDWQDCIVSPRVLFTRILRFLSLVLRVAFGAYIWLLEK